MRRWRGARCAGGSPPPDGGGAGRGRAVTARYSSARRISPGDLCITYRPDRESGNLLGRRSYAKVSIGRGRERRPRAALGRPTSGAPTPSRKSSSPSGANSGSPRPTASSSSPSGNSAFPTNSPPRVTWKRRARTTTASPTGSCGTPTIGGTGFPPTSRPRRSPRSKWVPLSPVGKSSRFPLSRPPPLRDSRP